MEENYKNLVTAVLIMAVQDLKTAYKRYDKSEARKIENEIKKYPFTAYVTDMSAQEIIKSCKENVR